MKKTNLLSMWLKGILGSIAVAIAMGSTFCALLVFSADTYAASKRSQINSMETTLSRDGSVSVMVKFATPSMRNDSIREMSRGELANRISASRQQIKPALDRLSVNGRADGFDHLPLLSLRVDRAGLEALAANPNLLSVSENRKLKPLLTQSVPRVFPGQASSPYLGNNEWTIAVLDTGIDKAHPFLTNKVVSEACYSDQNGIAQPSNVATSSVCPGGVTTSTATGSGEDCTFAGCDHGTHVAGIAAGNGGSFDGVAPLGKLISIQVFSYDAALGEVIAWTDDVLRGLDRVIALSSTQKIAAVNLSLGGGFSSTFCDTNDAAPAKTAIDTLRNLGIASVVAAGNDGFNNGVGFPACVSTAVTVSATLDTSDTAWINSNTGPQLDLFAPGVNITSSVPGGGFFALSGTSMAAPHVAGAFAAMKNKSPTATVAAMEAALKATGVNVTKGTGAQAVTRKRINIAQALAALTVVPPPPPPSSGGEFIPPIYLLLLN